MDLKQLLTTVNIYFNKSIILSIAFRGHSDDIRMFVAIGSSKLSKAFAGFTIQVEIGS